jgi:predicted  nucleic acid-binding Zn-ribbon protein
MDMLSEIDAALGLIEKRDLERAQIKLTKIRVGIQKLLEDLEEARQSTKEWQQRCQDISKRNAEAREALKVAQAKLSPNGLKRKKSNGSRRESKDDSN